MRLYFKYIIIGFIIAATTSFVLGYFSSILGGLVVGYLIADDYMDGAINGAIASAIVGLLYGVFYLLLFSRIFNTYGVSGGFEYVGIIFIAIAAIFAGLILGGIGGAAGVFIKEQSEIRNMQQNGVTSRKEDDGYLVCTNCNAYYKLQPNESPEDFNDECECGGKFRYYSNIDWLSKEEN
ncbi:hypothetical protein Metbo_1140 [Methanobacterium lacus]|uniref:Uncharacterized protein n=1 Tax=Methanobacterium lacus (strain AL-21) TaxID=877455 RepID=F0T5Z1_METLA|nr:DUF5518 domain-containing protein [Methanobacterium lacus]ADZ09384.1 hypothetical protein Metbo_1140 [Methanobacterium lacus]